MDRPGDGPIATIERHTGGVAKVRLLFESLLVGIVAGLVVVAYRFSLNQLTIMKENLFRQKSLEMVLLTSLLLVATGYLVGVLLKWAPYSGGSGIPQIHAELLGRLDYAPWPTLTSKFIGGSLNGFAGLSLGREGPSIQLGGTIGKIIAQGLKTDRLESSILMAAGASAGLSAAFNAPLAGVVFILEEIYGSFSATLLVPALVASLTANVVSFQCLGEKTAFQFAVPQLLPLHQIYWVFPVTLVASLIGLSFNLLLDRWRAYANRVPSLLNWRFSLLFLFSYGLFQLLPDVQGGGNALVENLAGHSYSLTFILVLLFGKLLFTCLSFDSGAQGGIFLPVLVLGAASGALSYQLASSLFPLGDYRANFMVIGMVAVLTAVVRAPILSIILIAEMTGTYTHFLALALASILAYGIAESMKVGPVYHTLYRHLVDKLPARLPQVQQFSTVSRYTLAPTSSLVGQSLSALDFPCKLLVVSIVREGQELVPGGEDRLYGSDQVVIAHNASDSEAIDRFFKSEN